MTTKPMSKNLPFGLVLGNYTYNRLSRDNVSYMSFRNLKWELQCVYVATGVVVEPFVRQTATDLALNMAAYPSYELVMDSSRWQTWTMKWRCGDELSPLDTYLSLAGEELMENPLKREELTDDLLEYFHFEELDAAAVEKYGKHVLV